jgi:hypothetical protein
MFILDNLYASLVSTCGTNQPVFCGFKPATKIDATRICMFNTLSKFL